MRFSNSIELTMTAESNAGKMRLGISGARMGWRALLAGVVFAAFAGSANAQDWYWTGAASANWSNPANWNSAADGTGTAPETVQDLFNKSLQLQAGPSLPEYQDIPDLAIRDLHLYSNLTSFAISGEPIQLNLIYNRNDPPEGNLTVTFSNDVVVASSSTWNVCSRVRLDFYGTVSETGGSQRIGGYGAGSLAFYGPVHLTGGWYSPQVNIFFYGMENIGAYPTNAVMSYMATGYGSFKFNLPEGEETYEYELGPNIGIQTTGSPNINIADNVVVRAEGPVNEDTPGKSITKWGGGTLILTAEPQLKGTFSVGDGIVDLRTPVNHGVGRFSLIGSLFLNGNDVSVDEYSFYNGTGAGGGGVMVNSDRERTSVIRGTITSLANWWTGHQFSGGGDIRLEADIAHTNTYYLSKLGAGNLYLTGKTYGWTGHLDCHGGSITWEYAGDASERIGDEASIRTCGDYTMLGNPEADTVEHIGTLNIGSITTPNRVEVTIAGQNGYKAALYAAGLSISANSPVKFQLGENGALYAIADNEVTGFLSANITCGDSFARMSDAADADGYRAIEPVPDGAYVTRFDATTENELVDVVDGLSFDDREAAAALRFRTPLSAPLSLPYPLMLRGGRGGNGYLGAILVTPEVGETPIEITGPQWLCGDDVNGTLHVHQNNPAAPLIIGARICNSSSGNSFTKSGAGELVLTNSATKFSALSVFGGTLSFTSITNAGYASSAGIGSSIRLGAATLRYIGTGDVTDKYINLRGHGTLDASGTGPLTLTAPTFINCEAGADHELTLTGTGEGVTLGIVNLPYGRIVKRGTGRWTLAGDGVNCWRGLAVEEGTLNLTGRLGRDVRVAAFATLEGSGTIDHDLVLEPEAILGYRAGEGGLAVGGTAQLSDAVLQVEGTLGTEYQELLTAENGVVGSFAVDPEARYQLLYTESSVLVRKQLSTLLSIH